jgi:amino acid adenylation domain-containing protein
MTRNSEFNTIRALIDRMAATQPDDAFLISPETGRVLTFKGLQEQAHRLHSHFRQMGLQYGDKIAFLMDNGLFTAQLFLGTMYGGFVAVPLNARAGVSQLSYTLDHCDAKIVFVGSQYDALTKEVLAHVRRPVEVVAADLDGYLDAAGTPSIADTLPAIRAEDAALLIYSSGTTGQPKGAVHTHRSVLAHGRNSARAHQLTAADRSLLVLPLYHINAECVTLLPTLTSGGSVVIPHGFAVSEFWDWLDDYRCTWSALVPTIISQLLDWKDPKAENRAAAFQRIRFLRSSSAPLSPALHREFVEKFRLPLIQAMGSTEAGNVFSNPAPPGTNKIGSPGLLWGFEGKIVDPEGAELPDGQPGEVLLRGDGLMRDYYKDPAETATLDAEGWLHTGDLAYRDEQGYFFVVGRSKELVIKGGMNIAPKQIDEILETHPAVLEAAAVGVPDRYLGEDLIAFAVLRNEMRCDEGELLSFCQGHLGYFKTPTRIHFVEDLPKGPSGKVQRLRLVEEAERRAVARSASLTDSSETRETDGYGEQNVLSAADHSIEKIIAGIWSDLLGEPQIDPQDNFFALGGQSLLAIQFLSRLREEIPIILSLSDFFENATVAQLAALARSRLSSSPAQETTGSAHFHVDSQSIPLRDRTVPCPLSLSQERLWFLEQLNPGVPVYNEPEAVRLKGELDVEVLEQALNVIIERHEILRTTIQATDGRPVAIVHESWPVKLKRIDLRHLPAGQREAELARLLIDEPRQLYRLEAEPGIRAWVIQLAAEEHVFMLMMHHIICDGLSVSILWRELGTLYEAFLFGQPSPLPPLPLQYGDYATWQRQPIQQMRFDEDLSFWRETLRGAPPVLELPADRPRPSVISHRGNRLEFCFDSTLAEHLRQLCRQERTSLFTIFAAALNTLLYRYTGQDDIPVGIPIGDRDRPELRPLIGFLIDTQVLRTDLSGNPTFRELLPRVQQGVVGAYSHRAVPFDQVVAALQPERDMSYSPVFQVMLNWRDNDTRPHFIGLPGLTLEPLLAQCRASKFDLQLILTDAGDGDGIYGEVEYSTDLFDEDRIERMVGHLRTLLEGAAANPEEPLATLPLLTSAERLDLVPPDKQLTAPTKYVHELFEAQVERTPDAVAVMFEESYLTYRELNRRADGLAQRLRALGVGPDVLVALFLERSLDMVVGMLGVLKAGGAYVPLDPRHPSKRLGYVLADAQPLVLLTHGRSQSELPPHRSHVVLIDADAPPDAGRLDQASAAGRARGPRDLAYVIYTSGSTGKPKGVEIEHCSVINMLASMQRRPGLDAEDGMLAITTLAFDIAVLEIFLPLTCGARVVIAAGETVGDAEALIGLIERSGASIMQATPTTLRMLLDAGWPGVPGLKILCGGEAWTAELASELLPRCGSLWNMYGPTETTVWSAVIKVEAGRPIVVGPPIANTGLYVLDGADQLVPVGVPGELHIGGDGLARGYLHRPQLTRERFVSDPFAAEPGARMYRTGDLVRRLADGTLEFLGRRDDQVKIRGHRVELGEIEAALKCHRAIARCAVVAQEDAHGDHRLVAYIIPAAGSAIDASELRLLLSETLPIYMVPGAFVSVTSFPLTPSGKLDRKALPPPDVAVQEIDAAFIEPRTPTEKVLARIWCDMLDLKQVGVRDNFFDRGGNSRLVVLVIGEINKKLEARLNVPEFFQNPTIEGLTRILERKGYARPELQVVRPEVEVLQLQPGHTGLPLYFIGAGTTEYQLAQLIGEDRAIFGTDAPPPGEWRTAIAAADRVALPTIEQLGELHSNALRAHTGPSPCVVAGYSLHGKIAFEAARALQRAGVKVALVLLLDARATTWRGFTSGAAWESLRWIWRDAAIKTSNDPPNIDALSVRLRNSWRLLRWLLARIPHIVKGRVSRSTQSGLAGYFDKNGTPIDTKTIMRFTRIAARSWHPRPIDTSAVLFRANMPGEEMLPGHDSTNGWRDLFARGLEIVQSPGDHTSMMLDGHVTAVARQIKEVLDRYEAVQNMETAGSDNETDAGVTSR